MGAARYVVGFVVGILRHSDGIRPFASVRRARGNLPLLSPQQGVSGGESCKSKWHCGGGSQRPRKKHTSRAPRLFLKFLIQTLVKTSGRRRENAFVPVNSYEIAHSVEQRSAIATLGKVPVKGRPLRRSKFVVDIIRNIPADVLAVYSHGFLTSFESHPRRPSWPSPVPECRRVGNIAGSGKNPSSACRP